MFCEGIDYENLILARQERIETEDFNCDDITDNEEIEIIYNPLIIRMEYNEKERLIKEDPVHWSKRFADFEAWYKKNPWFVF